MPPRRARNCQEGAPRGAPTIHGRDRVKGQSTSSGEGEKKRAPFGARTLRDLSAGRNPRPSSGASVPRRCGGGVVPLPASHRLLLRAGRHDVLAERGEEIIL